MAPQHKQKHVTRNQRRHAEKSFNITDYIDGFRTACLNRAKDIRNFANGCDSVVLNGDEWKHLKELTHMLTEQLEFLQDAWNTMIRLVKEHKIDIGKDKAYKTIESSRAHALRVATMFQLSHERHQNKGENAVAEKEVRHNEQAARNIGGASEKTETNIEANDKAPPELRVESARSSEQGEREKARKENHREADSVGVIVQASLTKITEEDVDESPENDATHKKERTTKITCCATVLGKEKTVHLKILYILS